MTRLVWGPDRLGPGWEQATLDLGSDDEGPVVATLVRPVPRGPAPRDAVLHVHGFNDYFFQTHVADVLTGQGYAFHALDLRKCGRSYRPWQTPHYCRDLHEYVPELDAAARYLREHHDRLVVLAHSTGGLVASLWAHRLRSAGVVDALVLNSPWFELNERWLMRTLHTRVTEALAPRDPLRVLAHRPSAYTEHLHVQHGGHWDYDLTLKRPESYPVRAGWLRAVRRGQARLARGLAIDAPVLVCAAARSGPNRPDNPDLGVQDTVLDVRHIVARAALLGPDVTIARIPDGVHDLSLSVDHAREEFFRVVTTWLDERLDRTGRP